MFNHRYTWIIHTFYSNLVFRPHSSLFFEFIVDCEWSSWRDWTRCPDCYQNPHHSYESIDGTSMPSAILLEARDAISGAEEGSGDGEDSATQDMIREFCEDSDACIDRYVIF